MATIITCKKCRRLGVSVCGRERCAVKRKPYPPGTAPGRGRGGRRRGLSEYGTQLKEKQVVKFSYGLRERQFRNYVMKAMVVKDGMSSNRLVAFLEKRLDNVVYRLGLATSRSQARQIVSHGHIHVNGRRVNIPSFQVREGDVVSLRPQSQGKGLFADLEIRLKNHAVAGWLLLDKKTFTGTVKGMPHIDVFDIPANLNNVMEFYSR
ncbi:MAG: 30S ribosomal protein S4 [Candidatus Niyogibacteria bacterium CG10_big_fil_rev_8_21_14_0_10_46_36]|uniref:Small ribosomal subunit protein uS4 n=1 Tax=Candidatus Niyogibacteria bacterium CG10_big_fil_rev_8_21_14_0_10_46_36 TaxID=1974726 RepID=A0A2H0TEA5_9BACT|nr:MAG: 30S ribosomal protein S4 [Candidatus Niyogibacteria bacterium CG10_big_fil_rev_8_21_14_0_10_46_36]